MKKKVKKSVFVIFISLLLILFPIVDCSAEILTASKPPTIDALASIVIDMQSGRVLYENNARVKRAMASTTKIMTAIVALENCSLEEIITVSKKAASISGSSMNLKQGEQLKLHDLLYGLLLNSGNDAAITIAEHIGGSIEGFAEMMNSKAKDIGAYDSSFVTPHGLDADGHYTTAYDLALMAKYALENPVFSKIVKTPSIVIAGRSLRNTNEMLSGYNGTDGVKTGFTGDAGRCLVTSATRGDMRLISVVLGCPTKLKRTDGSRKILDFAFSNFKQYVLVNSGDDFGEIPIIKGVNKSVRVLAEFGIRLPLSSVEIDALEIKIELPQNLNAPVNVGEEVGSITYLINNEPLVQVPIRTISTVRKKVMLDYIKDIVRIWVGIMKGRTNDEINYNSYEYQICAHFAGTMVS